jgi:galactokinase
VGTHGGSEDQTAILCSHATQLSQYHFLPVTHEASVNLAREWTFIVGVSGVHASKAGRVQARYNQLAHELSFLLELWHHATGRDDASLFAALHSDPAAAAALAALARAQDGGDRLVRRLEQFRVECDELIPGVMGHLARGEIGAIGPLVDRSHALAETVLENQLPETSHLANSARELGAAAASAFGAGFGGSVWALVRASGADGFLSRWRSDYRATFPHHAARSRFFASRPGPGAAELIPQR